MKVFVPFDYPEDMQKILEYLKTRGVINASAVDIEGLYSEFSIEECGTSWTSVDNNSLKEFACWLSEKEV